MPEKHIVWSKSLRPSFSMRAGSLCAADARRDQLNKSRKVIGAHSSVHRGGVVLHEPNIPSKRNGDGFMIIDEYRVFNGQGKLHTSRIRLPSTMAFLLMCLTVGLPGT